MIVIAGRPQQAMHAGGDDRQPPCGTFLLPPCVADADIIFCSGGDFLLLLYGRPMEEGRSFYFHAVVSIFFYLFPRLISAAAHWMSTILPHMVWL